MQIYVKKLGGPSFALDVDEGESVASVKQKIAQLPDGLPAWQSRVIYAGKQLADDQRLCDCNIGQEATLHLLVNPKAVPPAGYASPTHSEETIHSQKTERPCGDEKGSGSGSGSSCGITVYVKHPCGKTTAVSDLNPAVDTVGVVKYRIQNLDGIPVQLQTLSIHGRNLSDKTVLISADIGEEAIISLRVPKKQKCCGHSKYEPPPQPEYQTVFQGEQANFWNHVLELLYSIYLFFLPFLQKFIFPLTTPLWQLWVKLIRSFRSLLSSLWRDFVTNVWRSLVRVMKSGWTRWVSVYNTLIRPFQAVYKSWVTFYRESPIWSKLSTLRSKLNALWFTFTEKVRAIWRPISLLLTNIYSKLSKFATFITSLISRTFERLKVWVQAARESSYNPYRLVTWIRDSPKRRELADRFDRFMWKAWEFAGRQEKKFYLWIRDSALPFLRNLSSRLYRLVGLHALSEWIQLKINAYKERQAARAIAAAGQPYQPPQPYAVTLALRQFFRRLDQIIHPYLLAYVNFMAKVFSFVYKTLTPLGRLVWRVWSYVYSFFDYTQGINVGGFILDVRPSLRCIPTPLSPDSKAVFVMRDQSGYRIGLGNKNLSPALCTLKIDGADMGVFFLAGRSFYLVERPSNAKEKFFFAADVDDQKDDKKNIPQSLAKLDASKLTFEGDRGRVEASFQRTDSIVNHGGGRRNHHASAHHSSTTSPPDFSEPPPEESDAKESKDVLAGGKTLFVGRSEQNFMPMNFRKLNVPPQTIAVRLIPDPTKKK